MPPTTDSTFDTDIIVVGGGPVGLTTACALRHHGVSCRVLEKRTEIKPNSRANNLWARPQELLAAIGLRDALAETSYGIRQVNTLLNGQPTDPIEVADVMSPFPRVLYSGQDVIEKRLTETLEARGGSLERGQDVVGIEQDETGVTVTAKREDGREQRLRCRYLVGADGAESTVRSALGLDFETKKFEGRMNRQVDAKLSWRRSTEPDQLWFFYYEDGFAGVLPVWGGYHRLFFTQDDTGVPERDPTLEEMQALAREVTGDETVTLTDPIWFSHSRFQHGVAASYAQDRVFLAGDAGHLSLPIGGQGMNAGLHDAVGIAWRLAMTLAGRAAAPVLASYDGERQGEHARLNDQQAKGMRRVVYRGTVADTVLSLGARILPNIGSLIQGTDDLQQLAVCYPDSLLNEDKLTGLIGLIHAGGPKPGDRAPDAEVTCDGRTTTLFPYFYNPDGLSWGWALLAFDGRLPEASRILIEALRQIEPWDCVKPRLVLAGPLVGPQAIPVLSDLDGRAHGAYGLEGTPALILVRPDGHIAFRGRADRPDLLVAYCRKTFGEA
ncbi:FAD-dependent monooxygenase [Roseomonas gilardii]|uniref:FAD-dependent monooxygenase n=1 Tax=Roseomonas gilardii TaxID=257708 RepID=UPI00047F7EC1|nr:FAD-dependent monooxygenase [Roseomonas gilardii]